MMVERRILFVLVKLETCCLVVGLVDVDKGVSWDVYILSKIELRLN